jgi:Pyridoxamine 5'-phosphate oxidase
VLTVIKISPLMKELLSKALSDDTPCLVGTASREGRPQISPKGSLAVFDDQTLCYWERSHRSSQAHLEENGHTVVYYRNAERAGENPYRSSAVRFHGISRIVRGGPERERVWQLINEQERNKDAEKKGFAVLIDIYLIEELSGSVIMKRDD